MLCGGYANVDVPLTLCIEEGTECRYVNWSLRHVLQKEKVESEQLFHMAGEVEGGAVMVLAATGEERDAALQNICQCTPAYTMCKLLLDYGVEAT